MKHIMYLSADVFLNICYSIVLSLVIFIPYIYEYEPDQYSFNLPFLYGDEMFKKLVLENQSIFATSLLDFCAKFIPQVSVYLSLRSISFLVERNSSRPKLNSFHLVQLSYEATSPPEVLSNRFRVGGNQCSRLASFFRFVRVLFVCCGITILVVHLVAIKRLRGVSVPECKQIMHSWFALKYSCIAYKFNYCRQGVESVQPESFDFLDEQTLTATDLALPSAGHSAINPELSQPSRH